MPEGKPINKLLVANRGEIALRVMRSCHEMGIEAVCVFSSEDRDAEYLKLADRVVFAGQQHDVAPPDCGRKSARAIEAARSLSPSSVTVEGGAYSENTTWSASAAGARGGPRRWSRRAQERTRHVAKNATPARSVMAPPATAVAHPCPSHRSE